MTTDLTQLRWQHIRAVENSQQLIQENVDLKRQLGLLRESQASSDANRQQATKVVAAELKAQLRSLREDAELIRAQVSADSVEVITSFGELKHGMRKVVNLQTKRNNDFNKLQSELANLQKLYSELQSAHACLQQEKAGVSREAAEKSAKITQEAKTLESKYFSLMQDMETLREERDQLADKAQRAEALHAPCEASQLSLQREVSNLRKEVSRLKQDAADSSLNNVFEMTINDLRRENSVLLMDVASLRHQLEVLEAKASVPTNNRSHFAKFMELKNANVALQAQVDKLTRQVQTGQQHPLQRLAPSSATVTTAPTSKAVRHSRRRRGSNSSGTQTHLETISAGNDIEEYLPEERLSSANDQRATTTDSLIDTLKNNLHRRAVSNGNGMNLPPETDDFGRGIAPPVPVPMLSPFKLDSSQQASFRDETHRSGGNSKSPRYLQVSKNSASQQKHMKSRAGPRPSPYRVHKMTGMDDSSEDISSDMIDGANKGADEVVPKALGPHAVSVRRQQPNISSPRAV